MSRTEIPIFYEDDWGPTNQFGLHELIVACVADSSGQDQYALRNRFAANPKKGAGKLLAFCTSEIDRWPHLLFFAVFDADKLHKLLYASRRPTQEELLAELRARCSKPGLHLFLLVDNTETIVNAAAQCIGEAPPEKGKLLRDRILNRVANGTRQLRDCVRAAVPSFDHCVCQIAALSEPLLRRP